MPFRLTESSHPSRTARGRRAARPSASLARTRIGIAAAVLAAAWLSAPNADASAYTVTVTKQSEQPAQTSLQPVGEATPPAPEASANTTPAGGPATPLAVQNPSPPGDATRIRVIQAPGPEPGRRREGYAYTEGPLNALLGLSDIGLYGGYEYWTAPLTTSFFSAQDRWWAGRPAFQLGGGGVSFNLPLFPFLEIEPKAGLWFGGQSREARRPSGTARESLAYRAWEYGLDFILPLLRPGFLQLGLSGRSLSTTVDLETDVPAFTYEGFLLDNAVATELSVGAGLVSPADWPLRLRLGIVGFYQFADFGDSRGLRIYFAAHIRRWH